MDIYAYDAAGQDMKTHCESVHCLSQAYGQGKLCNTRLTRYFNRDCN